VTQHPQHVNEFVDEIGAQYGPSGRPSPDPLPPSQQAALDPEAPLRRAEDAIGTSPNPHPVFQTPHPLAPPVTALRPEPAVPVNQGKLISHWVGKVREAVEDAQTKQRALDEIAEAARLVMEAYGPDLDAAVAAEETATARKDEWALARIREERAKIEAEPGYQLARRILQVTKAASRG
jgi:hypothetical protein